MNWIIFNFFCPRGQIFRVFNLDLSFFVLLKKNEAGSQLGLDLGYRAMT